MKGFLSCPGVPDSAHAGKSPLHRQYHEHCAPLLGWYLLLLDLVSCQSEWENPKGTFCLHGYFWTCGEFNSHLVSFQKNVFCFYFRFIYKEPATLIVPKVCPLSSALIFLFHVLGYLWFRVMWGQWILPFYRVIWAREKISLLYAFQESLSRNACGHNWNSKNSSMGRNKHLGCHSWKYEKVLDVNWILHCEPIVFYPVGGKMVKVHRTPSWSSGAWVLAAGQLSRFRWS